MLSYTDLTPPQKDFVCRVTADLAVNTDRAVQAVYGDGSASPNGEKFAAKRLDASWGVVFDFGTGRCFHTAVQLPLKH